MAEIRDEHGNPTQLTDEHGNPVQLTDEHGNTMHLTGVAVTTVEVEMPAATYEEKIKEKLTAGKHMEEPSYTASVTSTTTETTTLPSGAGTYEHHENEKKSMMEKIKDKLPGHGHHST